MDVATLKDEVGRTAKVVDAVRADQFGLPTPCSGFDVRALINHLCVGSHFLAGVVDGGDAPPEYEKDFVGGDHSAAYKRAADDVLRAFETPGALEREVQLPGMRVPAMVALGLALMDAVVHRWDLARATDVDPDVDEDVAASLLDALRSLIPDEMRAAAPDLATASIPFGPIVEVPDDASQVNKLVAFLGRRP